MTNIQLTGLARRLVTDNLLDTDTAINAVEAARAEQLSLITYLVQNDLVDANTLAQVNADMFGMPLLNIDALDYNQVPRGLVPEDQLRQHRAIPLFKRGSRLFIAVSDPTNESAIESFRFNSGLSVEAILIPQDQLTRGIERILDGEDGGLDDFDYDNLETASTSVREEGAGGSEGANDAPVVRFVNKLLLSAIKRGASDLHFEPYESTYRVRFRVDGILQEVANPPIDLSAKISSRLKIMSSMDISERRKPQDGRIKLKLSKTKAIDFRVNTLPTLWGEKIVLRILDPSSAKMGIDMLGYQPDQKKMYMTALHKPQGMILVTGPTGSGKTVSLYTGLNILNTPERNISTAEDPVEINLEGINQVNVNPKQGMDFAQALRAFLRQDPDIIMVGEIRDLETANIAIKAAQTGHLVLSTLHTNSAAETLTRLQNMGVPSFNIATSVTLIIAQRLARRLCSCKRKANIPKATLLKEGFTEEQLNGVVIYNHNPSGCEKCNRGYKGRVGIYEVVSITPEIQSIIMEEGNSLQISEQARKAGFNNLRQSGLLKIMEGVTTLEEVNRVTQD